VNSLAVVVAAVHINDGKHPHPAGEECFERSIKINSAGCLTLINVGSLI
jgi:hypothetical protein